MLPNLEPVRVALVDDDDLFRESLELNLGDEGYSVLSFDRAMPALEYFLKGGQADIMLLDWRMPPMDGIDLLKQLRANGVDVPVIFLTVMSDEMYEEAALAGGAVDFVEKSRSLSIVLKRMELILSGRKGGDTPEPGEQGEQVEPAGGGEPQTSVRIGPLEMRLDVARAFWRGVRVDLTLTEFNIVKEMALRPEEDVSYRDLYDLVHGKGFVAGYGASGYRANVRAFIKRIRQKFRAIDPDFDRIENYAGFGYRWGDEAGRHDQAAD